MLKRYAGRVSMMFSPGFGNCDTLRIFLPILSPATKRYNFDGFSLTKRCLQTNGACPNVMARQVRCGHEGGASSVSRVIIVCPKAVCEPSTRGPAKTWCSGTRRLTCWAKCWIASTART